MWKTIYIARDITLANRLKQALRKKGIKATLNKLEIKQDELNGNIEILVLQSEAKDAFHFINESLIEENI